MYIINKYFYFELIRENYNPILIGFYVYSIIFGITVTLKKWKLIKAEYYSSKGRSR